MSRTRIVTLAVLALGFAPGSLWAQQSPSPPETPKAEAAKGEPKADAKTERSASHYQLTATLRVQVLISRFQGEKKTGSLPYTFSVTAGGDRVKMRMGVETPVPVTTFSPDREGMKPPTSFQYKNVGTNIDCSARDLGDGRYRLLMGIENSSALTGPERGTGTLTAEAPVFRRFEVNMDEVLRDGQSAQTVASTDPVTGEVVKIDVTMKVVK